MKSKQPKLQTQTHSQCFSFMAPKQTSSSDDTKLSVSKTIIKKDNMSDKEPKLVKRNNSPGFRVIHGKIYDSLNGKCCHQCRQKTLKFSVRCKNQTEDKQCTCYFCHSCLLNRYGVNAKETAELGDWKCPKCRGICNCSICRKKQGCCPIGRINKPSIPKTKTTKPKSTNVKKTNEGTETEKHSMSTKAQQEPKLGKRKKSPGVRVINGKIYDSQNGKCCHQCRQKTLNFSVKCNNQTGDKQCNFYFCHICLLNRYEEKAEEMAALGDWKCPKCRGICNCSICRKKQGCFPIGRISKRFASKTKTSKTKTSKIDKANMKAEIQKQNKLNKAREEQNSAKRKKSPGVRVIHGRIYDSQNGKCCHQCRQKTLDFSVKCKNQTEDKNCSFYFCHKCLSIRYGEKAEEMAALGDWKCPKCRAICNCSICRKKQGCRPTGRIMKAAKAEGFSSVSEMLQSKHEKDVNGSTGTSTLKSNCKFKGYDEKDGIPGTERITDNSSCNKDARIITIRAGGLLKNLFSSKQFQQDSAIASLRRCKNGSMLDGKNGRKLNFEVVKLVKKKEICESRLYDGSENLSDGYISEEKPSETEDPYIKQSGAKSRKRNPNITGPKEKCKRRITMENDEMDFFSSEDEIEESPSGIEDGGQSESRILHMEDLEENRKFKNKKEDNNSVAVVLTEDDGKQVDKFAKHQNVQAGDYHVETAMPQGIELTKVAEIDFAAEDVGHALQFLEFSEAFGKVLHMEKGQPECLLQELVSRQCSYHVGDSSIVGFHIKLLSMIQNNLEQNDSLDCGCAESWLQGLSKYIYDSRYQPKEILLDQIDLICKSYGELSSSKKLRLLTYLCDEALGSAELRNWMDKKILEYDEEERKGKENEKKKEKEVKSKLQNELARAVIADKGAPLSVLEHQDLVSNIKAEVAHTLAELVIEKNQKANAIRSEPMFLDGNGCKFWKLRGHSSENIILLQDICSEEAVKSTERWFSYNMEEAKIIEKYISRQLSK